VWDGHTGQPLTGPLNHSGWLSSAQFSSDGNWVLTGSLDGSAKVWDAKNGRLVVEYSGHRNPVISAQFSPDSTRIVTSSYDGTAHIWDALSGLLVVGPLRHESAVFSARFSPDEKWVVTAGSDQKARLWDARTGQHSIPPLEHAAAINLAVFSLDSKRVLTASDDHSARVWDTLSGWPLTEPLKHDGEVWWAEFSPDGKRLVTAATDQAAHVWDVAPSNSLAPDWLLPLAEVVSGYVINQQGVLEETKRNGVETLAQLKQRLDQTTNGNDWVIWGRWLLADSATRAISPLSLLSRTEAMKNRGSENGDESRMDSSHRYQLAEEESEARLALAQARKLWPDDATKWRPEIRNLAAVLRRQHQPGQARDLIQAASTPAAPANLLVNGSFELGDFEGQDSMKIKPEGGEVGGESMRLLPGNTYLAGWQVVGSPGLDVTWIGPANPYGVSAADGSFFLDLSGFHDAAPYGGVSQSFPTTIGQIYSLSFEVGGHTGFDPAALPSVAVAITGNSNTVCSVSSKGSNLWQLFKLTFNASATNTTLTFTGANTNNLAFIGLDNVVVTPVDPSLPADSKP
jgi:hypothetical protein